MWAPSNIFRISRTLSDLYMNRLSSLLANATTNTTYLDSALQSFQFIYNHLFDSFSETPFDGIGANDCVVGTSSDMADVGLFLEGVATLSVVTGNKTMQSLLVKPNWPRNSWSRFYLRVSNVTLKTINMASWQNPQGILYYNNASAGMLILSDP